MTLDDIILFVNILIFSVCEFVISIEVALYSMITCMVASKSLDYVTVGIAEYLSMTIISKNADKIQNFISVEFGRGVTLYMGRR